MHSIRSYLIIWLSLLFSVVWIAVTILTYISSQHEVEELFDAQLAQAAAVLAQIQHGNQQSAVVDAPQLEREVYGHRYEKKIAFQIWQDNQLLLRSASAITQPMATDVGYSEQFFQDFHWRVFRWEDTARNRTIITAERSDVRDELTHEITLDVLLPLTIALPALIVIIWLGVGRGLLPVKRIARQVAVLSPQQLDPVVTAQPVPQEINPLVEALNTLLAKLKTAFERERRFTADAAHELQTPLASIKTQAQVALRSRDPEQLRHALSQIEEGVNRTSHLVQQLLTLARYDPDTTKGLHEQVRLDALAAEVIAGLEPAAHQKNLELELNTGDNLVLAGNRTGLQILLRNLVDNAIRYCPGPGKISVTLQKDQQTIYIKVCDSGPGIPEQAYSRIFERFYRGDNHQHLTGSGLGLSIVQRIAAMHHGTIAFERNASTTEFCIVVNFPTQATSPRAGI